MEGIRNLTSLMRVSSVEDARSTSTDCGKKDFVDGDSKPTKHIEIEVPETWLLSAGEGFVKICDRHVITRKIPPERRMLSVRMKRKKCDDDKQGMTTKKRATT